MKTPLIVFVSLVLGFGLFYAYDRYSDLKSENLKLSEAVGSRQEAVDAETVESLEQQIAVHSDEVTSSPVLVQQKATVTGTLGYPSSGIPPLQVYAFNQGNDGVYAVVETAQNQSTFTMKDLPVGTYTFVAYPQLFLVV